MHWARRALWFTGLGIVAVSLATPLASARIWSKWLAWPDVLWVAPIPLASAAVFLVTWRTLSALARGEARPHSRPFFGAVGLFVALPVVAG